MIKQREATTKTKSYPRPSIIEYSIINAVAKAKESFFDYYVRVKLYYVKLIICGQVLNGATASNLGHNTEVPSSLSAVEVVGNTKETTSLQVFFSYRDRFAFSLTVNVFLPEKQLRTKRI